MESYAYRGKVQKGTLWCLEEGSYPHKGPIPPLGYVESSPGEHIRNPVWSLLQTSIKQVCHISPGN